MLMKTHGWIATDDSEPEFGKKVLVCTSFDGSRKIDVAEYDREYMTFVQYSRVDGKLALNRYGDIVTHWMPLPELP